MSDYRQMWTDLGMNLDRHDQLLEILGGAYSQCYLSQENRPKTMEYFDFVVSEAHGLRIKELDDHRKAGGKVIGAFCVYVPEDIVIAAGGVQVGLCAGADFAVPDSNGLIPTSTCPLIRASLGFKKSGACPYIQSSDLLVGETTCDGKKKMYEVLAKEQPTYIMELPQTKSNAAKDFFLSEVRRFRDKIEFITGNKIKSNKLAEATKKVEAKKQAMCRFNAVRAADPVPISGRDALLVEQISFYDDIDRFTAKVNELADELEYRVAKGIGVFPKGTPRILYTGTPSPLPDWKIHTIVEQAGGVIVGEESCVGSRYYTTVTPANDGTVEGMTKAISNRLMETHCACFTPNDERVTDISEMAQKLGADGVMHYSLAFCQPYAFEAMKIEKYLQKAKIPMLTLESDFSANDAGQLLTRVQAFVEMIGAK
jgi:benzoyl-CoA reductase/2-hydroxyglutaryl-CoA dehydratase subunit BcrC/BadD/HgdB